MVSDHFIDKFEIYWLWAAIFNAMRDFVGNSSHEDVDMAMNNNTNVIEEVLE